MAVLNTKKNAAFKPGRRIRILMVSIALAVTGCVDLVGQVIISPPDAGDPFAGDPFQPGDPGPANVHFVLDTREDVHEISPYIYGLNGKLMLSRNRPTAIHVGSNRTSALNWETSDSNAGKDVNHQNDDFFYQNTIENPPPPGGAFFPYIDANVALKVLSIPINDYVAADHNSSLGDVIFSENYLQTRFKQNRAKKNAPFTFDPDVNDDFVFQDEFVNWAKNRNEIGRVVFSLDNDPDRWDITHPRIRKRALTMNELIDRSVKYATAIKDAWPEAEVAGFSASSWLGLATLGDETIGKDDDNLSLHEYLDRMRAAGEQAERNLIDYLDLHYFPEAVGTNGEKVTGGGENYDAEAGAYARMQAPRSLFDESYVQTPGKGTNAWLGNEGLALIPRLKRAISDHYPGLKLMISIWGYGAMAHISGAIAAADALGIMGREGVDAAMSFDVYDHPDDMIFFYAGFRIYRDFDDNDGEFGDTSFLSLTDDIENTSVYGSYDADNTDRVVIVAINKSNETLTAGITLAHKVSFTHLEIHLLDASQPEIQNAPEVERTHRNAFLYDMPPRSISVLVPKS